MAVTSPLFSPAVVCVQYCPAFRLLHFVFVLDNRSRYPSTVGGLQSFFHTLPVSSHLTNFSHFAINRVFRKKSNNKGQQLFLLFIEEFNGTRHNKAVAIQAHITSKTHKTDRPTARPPNQPINQQANTNFSLSSSRI